MLGVVKLVVMIAAMGFASSARAETNAPALDKLKVIESNTEGRLGVFAINTQNGHIVHYRADQVFPTQCTSKTIGVAAVLKKSTSDPSLLSRKIVYSKSDLDKGKWNPITKDHVEEGMTVSELCAAAISFSDSTAMNLLLKTIGGIKGMNDFARSTGDDSFRQDNDWPGESYSGGEGNLKDSSTPKAMVEILRKITIDQTLDRPQRDLLASWLINTKTGAARIRAAAPKNWIVGNKTGTGSVYGSTNDLAIIWPPKHEPILIGIFYTSNNKNAVVREDVISAATKVIIDEFMERDSNLF